MYEIQERVCHIVQLRVLRRGLGPCRLLRRRSIRLQQPIGDDHGVAFVVFTSRPR